MIELTDFTERAIVSVKRLYTHHYGGDCYDFAKGQLYAAVSEPTIDTDYSPNTINRYCWIVAIGDDARDQFDNAGWTTDASFWIAVEDTAPVSNDLDAQIRAAYALTGGVIGADSLSMEVHK